MKEERKGQMKETEMERQKKPQDLSKCFTKFKKGDRVVIILGAKRQGQTSELIEGPAKVKEVNLVGKGKKPQLVFIADDLTEDEETSLVALLQEYIDMFAWSLDELKGVDPRVVTHNIPMVSDAMPIKQ